MLFNSWQFLIFFPAVFFLFYALPHRFRWQMLLTASCIFYMAFIPKYLLILFLTIAVDYVAAIQISQSTGNRRQAWLYGSVITTCVILFFFKYFDFFAVNVSDLAHFIGWNYSIEALHLILPIGLSFHTFQSLSYVVEVYRGNQQPEKKFGIYALYVMFFPQLVAGPIERPQNLLHQFHEEKRPDYVGLAAGSKLLAWGLFKKVVIADRLATFVTPVFANPSGFDSFAIFIAVVFFYFQVYADFSGYSDIARGAARMLGFNLMQNFDLPFVSKSLTEFWKRWHISLSTWLRDYVYEPLALSWRGFGILGIGAALFVTFLVSGFWHGAMWTFVCWGVLHGIFLVLELLAMKTFKVKNRIFPPAVGNSLGLIRTFLLVCLSYVFFRSTNIGNAFLMLETFLDGLFPLHNFVVNVLPHSIKTTSQIGQQFSLSLFLIVFLMATEVISSRGGIDRALRMLPVFLRVPVYQAAVFAIVGLGVWFNESNQFIYFQF